MICKRGVNYSWGWVKEPAKLELPEPAVGLRHVKGPWLASVCSGWAHRAVSAPTGTAGGLGHWEAPHRYKDWSFGQGLEATLLPMASIGMLHP